MSRIVFRALVALTLIVMFLARRSGGRMNPFLFLPFYYWFIASVFVFACFGILAAVKAWRDPHNRRAYLFDILLAASWVPYWFGNLR
ncbi:MAG: hypothetical protein ABUS51_02095 [Acidobacteriota bacterium]